MVAGRTAPSVTLAPTAETRRELATAANDCVSSRAEAQELAADALARVRRRLAAHGTRPTFEDEAVRCCLCNAPVATLTTITTRPHSSTANPTNASASTSAATLSRAAEAGGLPRRLRGARGNELALG